MANGQFIAPGSRANEQFRHVKNDVYSVPVGYADEVVVDDSIRRAVDEIFEGHIGQAVDEAIVESNETRLQESLDEILENNPELARALYSRVLDIQVDIEELRAFADKGVLPMTISERFMSLFAQSPQPFDERLVDAESNYGGEVFYGKDADKVGARFWYFENDWFFERSYDGKGFQVIRYQVLDDSMHKLFDGFEYSFTPGEKETLLQAINLYFDVISKKLYDTPNNYALAA
ncbi:MAG: hypothetical protein V4611_00795 [Patescibacteria group bacterium]